MRKLLYVLIIVLAVSLISGCSGGDSESATTKIAAGGSQSPQASSSENMQASSTADSQGLLIKPEQLISTEEAGTLIGETVKAGVCETVPLLGLSTCFYAPENADSKSYLQICVIQQQGTEGGTQGSEPSGQPSASSQSSESSSASPSASSQPSESGGGSSGSGGGQISPKSLYEGIKKIFSDPNTAVAGRIGDDTFISAQGISILSGEYCIIVLAGCQDPANAEEILEQAGELAVSNLKRITGE